MSKNDFEIKRFGRYLLLDHLVDGGMAKICRARFLGEQANKIVAIKMIQPQFSNDPNFVQMFKDELKVTFGLIHPNIAQTYDYGEVESTLYTAMEYVDGANLKQFLDRLRKRKFVFPVEISTYIISQVCQALFYAHTFTDKLTGKKFNIIHRDISPHNIMLTYDGAVKVIDFGIAKAETNSEATQAGTIKGKLSYLAPEYLEGLELDHRYDQFSVGITLWEMLCSRKLFKASNDLAVLKEIQACKIPIPSTINPNVPKELDEIVLKALHRDRTQRFKDMDAFNRALVRFLYSNYPEFNATDLSFFAKELFKDDIVKDREKLKEYGKIDIDPYLRDYENSLNKGPATGVDASTVEALIVRKKSSEVELDMGKDGTEIDLEFTRTTPRNELHGGGASHQKKFKKVANGGVSQGSRARRTEAGGTSSRYDRSGTYERSGLIDVSQNNRSSKFWYVAIALVAVIVVGKNYFPDQTQAVLAKLGLKKKAARSACEEDPNSDECLDQSIDSSQDGRRVANLPGSAGDKSEGVIYFDGFQPGMEIQINGKVFDFSPFGVKVPLNEKLKITVSKKNHVSHKKSVNLNEVQDTATIKIPSLRMRREGLLTSQPGFPSGSVLYFKLNGERFKKPLPFKDIRVPSGIYDVYVVDKKGKPLQKTTLKIEENRRHLLEKK